MISSSLRALVLTASLSGSLFAVACTSGQGSDASSSDGGSSKASGDCSDVGGSCIGADPSERPNCKEYAGPANAIADAKSKCEDSGDTWSTSPCSNHRSYNYGCQLGVAELALCGTVYAEYSPDELEGVRSACTSRGGTPVP
ncbi:MAG: hypothetical protein KIT84_28845 [Labilithrix sp.]|nr:hypothetical protein [Labilithrix sp.]MCW5815069.1 hypothetical protein [Labilithrix sp.]